MRRCAGQRCDEGAQREMASLLLDEDPAARHKPVHMGDALPVGSPAAETSALMDELKAETDAALEDAPEN